MEEYIRNIQAQYAEILSTSEAQTKLLETQTKQIRQFKRTLDELPAQTRRERIRYHHFQLRLSRRQQSGSPVNRIARAVSERRPEPLQADVNMEEPAEESMTEEEEVVENAVVLAQDLDPMEEHEEQEENERGVENPGDPEIIDVEEYVPQQQVQRPIEPPAPIIPLQQQLAQPPAPVIPLQPQIQPPDLQRYNRNRELFERKDHICAVLGGSLQGTVYEALKPAQRQKQRVAVSRWLVLNEDLNPNLPDIGTPGNMHIFRIPSVVPVNAEDQWAIFCEKPGRVVGSNKHYYIYAGQFIINQSIDIPLAEWRGIDSKIKNIWTKRLSKKSAGVGWCYEKLRHDGVVNHTRGLSVEDIRRLFNSTERPYIRLQRRYFQPVGYREDLYRALLNAKRGQ